MNAGLLKACVAEVLGTFILVFFGCGSVHSAVLLGGLVGLWQVGIVWGLAIMLAVYAVGAVSGAAEFARFIHSEIRALYRSRLSSVPCSPR